ncbi:hypothetical protein J2T17_000417 [Paenibacillus mucilaginosus]|uniref:coat protein F n=1 Tax=Paenibacillus mucilaginosus TaxID=61624 RepID=UPI003D19A1CD
MHIGGTQIQTPTGRLAPHETIELHELLNFKSLSLIKMKQAVGHIADPQLKQLYLQNIEMTEAQIVELLQLLQYRPVIG